MMIFLPLLVLADVAIKFFFLRLEGMGAICLRQETMFIHIVIYVPTNVILPFQNFYFSPFLCQFLSNYTAC